MATNLTERALASDGSGLMPCLFPRLGADNQAQKRLMSIKVNAGQASELQRLAVEGGDALSLTLRVAWAILLNCYSGCEEVCFGYHEVSALGENDNMADARPVRLALGADTTIKQLAQRAKDDDVANYGAAPFTAIGAESFNTELEVRMHPRRLTADIAPRRSSMMLSDNYRLRVLANVADESVSLFLEWWSSDMTAGQAAGVASTFDKALSYSLTRSDLTIGELDLFSHRHMDDVLRFNASPLEKANKCIHEVISEQAVQSPDSEAICAWDGSLNFRELDELSSRLSYRLVELGVGPEVRVPLCFDKSKKWNIVAMLAVSKAGGAFVPLDPSHPIQRIQGLAQAVEASVLLCSRRHANSLASVSSTVFPVDSEAFDALLASHGPLGHASRCEPNNAAYLIFTSGSTGVPKGTVVEHSAYCSSAKAHASRLLIDNTSRVLMFAAHTFDSSLVESLTPLMHGACVCIPSEEQRLNTTVAAMNELRVNHAILTPSFVDVIEPSAVPGLQTLVLAGEAMSESHVATWSKINLVNGYGPTESSVSAVINSKVTPDTDPKDIGLPVGVHCWIVNPDDHSRLVPPGCIGELLISGHTLAREYLNNPEKTKESFIYDPSWFRRFNESSRRFYKTGDLVRYNSAEGGLSYVGRKDTQVKYHGQRIELGEIEAHVNADPCTKQALVLLPRLGHYNGRLVAVFSLSEKMGPTHFDKLESLKLVESPEKDSRLKEILERLAKRIPAYMVPSAWLCVERLPILTSGKLDRKSVSKWVDETSEEFTQQPLATASSVGNHDETTTDTEDKLRQIWSRTLNVPVEKMSLSRSFLSAGGDSITAMTCVSLCQTAGLGYTVQEVLRSKSIRHLARLTKDVTRAVDYEDNVDQEFDLSPIQLFHFRKRRKGQGHFNQSFFLRLSRRIEESDLCVAIDAVVDRHSMLRAKFSQIKSTGEWKQRITTDISSSWRFRAHRVRTSVDAESEIANSQMCLNVVDGPVLAVDLFEVDGDNQLLSMIAHHLVIDLVSWRVILEDLEELLRNPLNPRFPPKSLPFQMWQKMQRENAQQSPALDVLPAGDVPTGDFSYWGMIDPLNTYGDTACTGFEVDAATASLLTNECNSRLSTETVDILVSALLHSFRQSFVDRSTPAIYNEGHGREPWDDSIDIGRTVGWFTTVYPIYTPVSTSDDLVDVAKRVRDIRRRVPGNGRPYFASRFHTKQGGERFGHHGQMEVAFNYLGQYQQLERDGALLRPTNEMAGEAHEAGGTADFGQSTPRFALFEISAVIIQGKLRFSFTFNRYMKHQVTIRQWISRCESDLRRLADEIARTRSTAATQDFPLLSLNDATREALINETLPRIGVSSLADLEDAYPCSPMQRGILLSRMKSRDLYSLHGTYEVKSPGSAPVDVDTLTTAWKRIVQRHQALRTVFVEGLTNEDIYGQIVLKDIDAEPVHLRCASHTDVLEILDKLIEPDYNDRPPHRFTICQTSAGRVFCRLEVSHAIVDGASISVIFRDLQLAYAGILSELQGPLYSDFVAYLQKQPADTGLPFWKDYLNGIEPCHFPALNDGVSGRKRLGRLRLEYNGLLDLQAFCDTNGLTIPNAIHVAWGLTLRRYVDADDVCFGYLSSERDAPVAGLDTVVGLLINMLVCRVKIPADAKVAHVLDRVQTDFIDSLPHKHTSLADVQHVLGLSDCPLFNTCVSYRKLPRKSTSEVPVIEFCEHCPIHDPGEYPIALNVEATDSDAAIDLGYWTDSISDRQAKNVAHTFMLFLDHIAQNSQQRVGQLNGISDRDWKQIGTWNGDTSEPIHDCVHRVVERQVKYRPDAPAVIGWDCQLSYRQLDDLSKRLAHYLVAHKVAPETFVAVCFDRSSLAIISMLAVLKAGAACILVDAALPKSTLGARVFDSRSRIVLASPEYASLFEDMVRHVIPVDSSLLDQLPKHSSDPCDDVGPSNASFIMFTQSTTNKANGVVLEHRAMASSAEAHGSALGVGPQSRVLHHAPYDTGRSLQEIFTTLQRGGCVCVPSENDISGNFAGTINNFDVNYLSLEPNVASSLRSSVVPKVETLVVTDRTITKKVQEKWGDTVKLLQVHGYLECSTVATLNSLSDTTGGMSNIGRSIGSASWVVDPTDHHKLVPVGCVGELLIEGNVLARGYFNDEESTSQRFIKNPAWACKNANRQPPSSRRMFKTGDLVRYNSDGSILHLGRKDMQAKLNGQRIDLQRVEKHINSKLPQGGESVAQLVAVADVNRLVALLCFQPDYSFSDTDDVILPMSSSVRSAVQSLDAAISAAVPSCMVPSLYIPVSSIPRKPSGKVDRDRLAVLVQGMTLEKAETYKSAVSNGRTPSTETEITLRDLWAKVLSKPTDAIGIDDNFFHHGGDSIGAIKLVAAALSKGIALTVADIFQRPKLSEMALNISSASQSFPSSGASSKPATELQGEITPYSLLPNNMAPDKLIDEVAHICRVGPELVEDIYPCTSIQAGLIALSNKTPGAYVAQTTFELPSNVNFGKFQKAWQAVVDAEAVLRTRIVFSEELGFLQVVVKSSIEWNSVSDPRDIGDKSRQLPLHEGGELCSYTLVGEETATPHFMWTVHHALYDGWSMPILLNKVAACYKNSSPPPLLAGTPFHHFIEYLSSIDLKKSDDYWISRLKNSTAARFPDTPGSRYQAQPTSKLSKDMPVPSIPVSENTLASVIRGSWALIASLYSYSDDVIFGEIMNGRDAPVPGIGDMIGPTLTTVPCRVQLDYDITVAEFLKEVQSQMAQVLPYQFSGIQNIKRLGLEASKACEFQNCISISQEADASIDKFWNISKSSMDGTNFYTYPLAMACTIKQEKMNLEANYDPALIPPWQMDRLLCQFETIIQRLAAASATNVKIRDVDFVSEQDLGLIGAVNGNRSGTGAHYIHDTFHSRASSDPELQAICAWDGVLTYQELDELSSTLACHLMDLGMGADPQTLVPICFERSAAVVVSMLAVLKVGGTIVPLDAQHSVSRIQEIVNDVCPFLALCASEHLELCESIVPNAMAVDLVFVKNLKRCNYRIPPMPASNAAYVVYTPDTSGKLTSTRVEHAAVNASASSFAPTSPTATLHFASQALETSLAEILAVLVIGGWVCIPRHLDGLADDNEIASGVNVKMSLLTPYFVNLVTPGDTSELESFIPRRQESCKSLPSRRDTLNARQTSSRTETSASRLIDDSNHSTISRRADRCWIVDARNHNRLCPVGTVGELVVEGPSLGSLRFDQPKRTSIAFIESPKWAQYQPGLADRFLCKTGNLVKYCHDGSMAISFVGRKGNQTNKTKPSQRFDIEKAENRPKNDDQVINVGVAAPNEARDCHPEQVAVQTTNLESTLIKTKREVEVKSHFDVAEIVRETWSHVLKLPFEKIDTGASFMHLGGDSISAMQVMARCRSHDVRVTVQDIIGSESVSELAKKATRPKGASIQTTEDEKPFNLSPIQQVYLDNVGDNWRQFNQSMLMRLTQRISTHTMQGALDQLVAVHAMLRARFERSQDHSWKQRISRDVRESYRFRTHTTEPHRIASVIEESQKFLDIERGPLVAFDMFSLPGGGHQLSITAHHLVVDVVSWHILLQDLEDLIKGTPLKPQNTLSFQIWSQLQEENAQEIHTRRTLPVTDIPEPDYEYWGMSGQPNIFGDIWADELKLDTESAKQFLEACHHSQTEPLDSLLASILLSFRQEFADRKSFPMIFVEGHGRESWDPSIDISSTVGWFTSLSPVALPTHVDINKDDSFLHAVQYVKGFRGRTPGKGRDYFAYHTLTASGRERFSKHWPMEIAFNYLGQMKSSVSGNTLLQKIDGGQSVNTSSNIGPNVPRFALLEISAIVLDGELKMSFHYNRHMERINAIQSWVNRCDLLLKDAARCLQGRDKGPRTMREFPLLPLSYGGVSKLAEQFPVIGISSFDEIEDVYPCSPMQQGMLISQVKDLTKYACSFIFEVRPTWSKQQVDVDQLEASWQRVVQRHATLRTVFVESISDQGLMDQVVLKHYPGRVVHCRADATDFRHILSDLEPLDYRETVPPHRLTICKTASGGVYVKLDISHAIADGSSLPIILKDLSKAYESGHFSTSGPLYSDFIGHLQTVSKDEEVAYWKKYLSDVVPCTFPSLPDHSKPYERQPSSYYLDLGDGADLQTFCADQDLTAPDVLQFVWGLVLRIYSGSNDICFGHVASGRNVPVEKIADTVGAFINMLICRISLSDGTVVSELLQKSRRERLEGMEYQSCSLADVQHELGLSDVKLFNTVFTYQVRGGRTLEEEALTFESLDGLDPTEFVMAVNASTTETSLGVNFSYSTDTICDSQAENVAKTFEHILRDLIKNHCKDRTIGDIDFFSEHSCQAVLKLNRQPPTNIDKCVHDIIQQQALLRPRSATAVHGWDASFTYTELNELSSHVAAHLAGLGVGPDIYVPVLFEKSAWVVVAYLAILKAGGAFVPLDPTHPDKRLRSLVNDVGGDVILCSHLYREKAARIANATLVVDEESVRSLANQPSTLPISHPVPSNAAYIIFTSGTTGKPKGTVITHAAICSSAVAHAKALLMDSSSRVFQFSSFTFDASIAEIITALIVGACTCIPNDEERMNDIASAICKLQATWLFLTPSVLTTLKKEKVPTLKVIVIGGEMIPSKLFDEWSGGPAILEAYGPTETAVMAMASLKVGRDGKLVDGNAAGIGKVVACRSWIVDCDNCDKLAPVGAVGELVLEGAAVGRGYFNNLEKTAEVFIKNPGFTRDRRLRTVFSASHLMYRTGDLVRYNPDGTLNFISRRDTQIKLNGQRIEVGEIEYHCKAALPAQFQAAVELITPPDQPKIKTLAVYFDIQDNAPIGKSTLTKANGSTADELLLPMTDAIRSLARSLENSLSAALPTYMIPHIFVPVTKLPWSTSGKLDRNRIRNMTQELSKETIRTYRLMGSTSKRVVASGMAGELQKLWEEILGLTSGSVRLKDNFFRLGGDSLAAMRLSGAARSQGIALSFAGIFKNPIFQDMVKLCNTATPEGKGNPTRFGLLEGSVESIISEAAALCHLNSHAIQDIYPPSTLQEGLITLSVKQPGAYVAQNVFRLSPNLDIGRFKAAWQTVVDDLDTLRTRIVHTASSNFVQVVIKRVPIDWESAADLSEITSRSAHIPTHNGGSLTKFTLIEDTTSSSRLFVLSIHHALYDGWSLPVILKRVKSAYLGGPQSSAPVPYSLFIHYLSKRSSEESKNFWRRQLDEVFTTPFPHMASSTTTASPGTLAIRHKTRLPATAMGGDVTISSILRGTWAIVVSGQTGTDDVCFGETLSGRNIDVPGITDIVGPTLTTVPTRIRVNRSLSVMEYLQDAQKSATDVVPHQHIGLQHIRRLGSDAAAACDFQNLLVIQMAENEDTGDFWDLQPPDDSQNFFTYPLVVECNVTKSEVEIVMHYKAEVLGSWHAQCLIDQFISVLGQLLESTTDPEKRLHDINVFSPADKEVVTRWNRRNMPVVDRCVHDSILQMAELQGQKPAVCDRYMQISYEELHDYASRVAIYLASLEVGPEDLVPICVDKSVWAVVAILGVLVAGAAFVPLDPSHPSSRHREIVEETGAKVAIVSPNHASRFCHLRYVVAIENKMVTSLPKRRSQSQLSRFQLLSNAAYVIFTSGSTGRPKGVVIEHGAFSSSSAGMVQALHMHLESRVFQFASLSFDAACLEILTTLTVGGCVCVPSEDERLADTAGALRRMNVTCTALTPSLVSIMEPNEVPSLEVLVCVGETLTADVVSKWGDKVRLMNGYGPSETSVLATVNSKASSSPNASCIGVGIQPTLTWLLDPLDHNKLAPLGGVAEVALSGPALARGYLNNPQRTAEVFIDCPCWAPDFDICLRSNRRIYKTGDLVKYNQDGTLDFIGRKDDQIKLHGQRIELGEIEHRLDVEPLVCNALVVLPQEGPCKKQLVAVVALRNLLPNTFDRSTSEFEIVNNGPSLIQARVELKSIRDHLSEQLPPFMVPQVWIAVKSIPMLTSGKLDRRLAMEFVQSMDRQTFDEVMEHEEGANAVTATGTAKLIQEIWSVVLNLPLAKVKLDKSFLSLGGDSITAMTVMSRCRKENITLSLHDVLRSKSISALAERAVPVVTASRTETVDELFDLSPIQKLYFQTSTSFSGDNRFNQSMSLRVTRPISGNNFTRALETIVNQHSMLRARFSQDQKGVWKQRITEDVDGSYHYQVHKVDGIYEIPPIIAKSQTSLDIENGPIISADFFGTRTDEQFIFLVVHHLCIDMISWRIILQDLQELLDQGTLSLDRPLSFQVWCSMQTERDKRCEVGMVLPFQIKPPKFSYWGIESSDNTYRDTELETFTLGKELTEVALGDANKAFQTEPLDLFLSAVAHSFAKVFWDREVPTIFNEGHGRESWEAGPDPSRTVGWFTTISPVQIPVDTVSVQKEDVLHTLRQTKDIRRSIPTGRLAHFAQNINPFDQDSRDTGPNFPAEIIFNYLGRMQQFEREDSLFQTTDFSGNEADAKAVGDVGPNAVRLALFELSVLVSHGQIKFSFIFNRNVRHHQDVRRWAFECKRTLEETITSMARSSPEPTLSDYPLLPISYDGLRKLANATLPRIGVNHRDEVEDIYPCSSMQEGILLSQIRDPNAYLVNAVFEVKDRRPRYLVDAQRLATAWQKVVDRHPALRTVFIDSLCRGSTFDQVVVKQADSGIVVVHCNDSEAIDKLSEIKLADYNYKKRPKLPHQLALCTTTNGRVFVKTELNHAVIDGRSTAIMMRDLALAYEGKLPSGPGPLFSNYVRFIRDQPSKKDIDFWKQYLCGIRPCHLPRLNNQARPERRLSAIRVEFDRFPELQDVCDRTKVTLANIMHTTWALVLRTYTKSDDVCFGYLSAGRDAPVDGVQDTIGSFINMLCCRVQFTSSSDLDTVLRKVQDDYIDSLPYQTCSLSRVQHELGLAGKALYNTVLSIQNHTRASDAAEETLVFETLEGHDPSEYAVTVNAGTTRNYERVVIRYWSDYVSQEEAGKLANLVARVLDIFAASQGRRISEFDGIEVQESKRIQPVAQPGMLATQSSGRASRNDSPRSPDQISAHQPPLTENDIDLKKMVEASVREVIQQMLKAGNMSPSNGNELTKLLSKSSAEEEESHARGVKAPKESSPGTQSKKVEPWQSLDYNPTLDLDSGSIEPQLKQLGRSADVEKKLLGIWSLVLEIDEDSIADEDSFFECGGDSLTAMKLVGAARDEGLSLTVADVFRSPVFEDMAAIVRSASIMSAYIEDAAMSDCKTQTKAIRSAANSDLYQRFSLVNTSNVDTFLQSNICPKVGVFKGGIADVLPVTDFQALAITGSLLESRWMLNYFYLDGRGQVDLRQLKHTAFKLVQSVDILRTVFLPCGDRFLQVVLRKMRPEFSVYETEADLDEFTATIRQRDREDGPRLGESFVSFTVVKQGESDRHRILIRASHAQYDGVCMPKIIEALRAGYQEVPLPIMSSFASYVRASAGAVAADHYQHWRSLLMGSRMTEIIHRDGPNYRRSAGATSTLSQTILLPSIAHGNITTATVIKAAWAMVLAKLSGRPDVVFGHTISGRNVTVPNVDTTVGPCLNIVPVRVQFGEEWTALDLLRFVQDQQVANMPYEMLGFREITRHCTEWPDWTNFTTLVQHQNASVWSGDDVQIGRNSYKVGIIGADESFSDISVLSNPLDSNRCEIHLCFSLNGEITPIFAQKVLHMLCNTASDFVADPSISLPSPKQISELPPQTFNEAESPTDSYYQSSQLQGLTGAELLVLSDILSRSWRQILGAENTHDLQLESSFFQLNGDIMGVAQLAWLLEQDGFKVRIEDLIDHPTMLGQIAVMCSAKAEQPPNSTMTTLVEQHEETGHVPKVEKSGSSWTKAVDKARKLVRRNTSRAV